MLDRVGINLHTERATASPTFRHMSIVAKRSSISATVELLLNTSDNQFGFKKGLGCSFGTRVVHSVVDGQ